MAAGRYLLRRAGFALLLVAVVSSASLVLVRLAPGDATAAEALEMTAEERARVRAQLGLDRPLLAQYVDWASHAVRLDFGQSFLYARPVSDLLGERARNTAVLASSALVLATLIGLPLGVLTGSRPDTIGAAVTRALSLLALSVPPLVAALLLVLLAARTGWMPVGGMTSLAAASGTWGAWLSDVARHVPLPALALALPFAATLERVQSEAVADAVAEPFVRAARARGLTYGDAVRRHAWRASLRPVLGIYGLIIGSLFSGSFIVEVVTAWPGLGRLMFDALRARDLYLVAGTAATGAAFLALGTLIADALLALADPRVAEEREP
ncbi:MAG: ABC transporter permease [Acidobacteriota bacterium]